MSTTEANQSVPDQAVVIRPGTTITVTQDDIKNGCGGSATACPVALAVQRVIPSECYPYVVCDWMEIVRDDETLQRMDLPFDVGQFVLRFDEWWEFGECDCAEDYSEFWENHNCGEPYDVEVPEPITFVIPS